MILSSQWWHSILSVSTSEIKALYQQITYCVPSSLINEWWLKPGELGSTTSSDALIKLCADSGPTPGGSG